MAVGLDLVGRFIGVVRAALGLDPDPGQPPDILHLGLYPSRVDACASDGSTCDVTPANALISARKNVPVRAGIPGAVAVVEPGAIVCLAFEGGDPGQPFIDPTWTQGATVSKLVVNAQMVYIGAEAGAEALVKKSDFDNHTHQVPYVPGTSGSATATAAKPTAAAGTTQLKAV